jgi:hypothetical protein
MFGTPVPARGGPADAGLELRRRAEHLRHGRPFTPGSATAEPSCTRTVQREGSRPLELARHSREDDALRRGAAEAALELLVRGAAIGRAATEAASGGRWRETERSSGAAPQRLDFDHDR